MVGPDRADTDSERTPYGHAQDPWPMRPGAPVGPVPGPGPLGVQIDRLRRRWWLVAAIGVLALLGSLGSALLTPTAYTGRSALTVATETRAPEQDAYLAQAYSEYFNQRSYQAGLAERARLPDGIAYNARTAATSPIVYIEATAADESVAVDAAARMSDVFRDDVNTSIGGPAGALVADLQSQLDRAERRLSSGPPEEEATALDTEIRSLQERVVGLQSARTNELRTLQRRASVSSSTPSPVQDGLLGLAGGLVLGGALVLVLAALAGRLATPQDIRERLGLPTLGKVGGRRGRRAGDRAQDLKRLTTVLAMSDLSWPRVLAMTSPEDIRGRSEVAHAVATYRARQGERTVLVRTSFSADVDAWAGPGALEYLAAPSQAPLDAYLRATDVPGLRVMAAGRPVSDPFSLFGPERVATLVQQLRPEADLIVIDAPSLIPNPEAAAICAAADGVVLVVEEEVTRGAVAATVCALLERVHAPVLGAVLFQPSTGAAQEHLARVVVGPVPDLRPPHGPILPPPTVPRTGPPASGHGAAPAPLGPAPASPSMEPWRPGTNGSAGAGSCRPSPGPRGHEQQGLPVSPAAADPVSGR